MDEPTRHLLGLARRITEVYASRIPTRAALVTGSAARGDADFFSDLDLLFYADEAPSPEAFAAAREELGGLTPVPLGATGEDVAEQYHLGGVPCQIGYTTVAQMDAYLDTLLVRFEEVDTPLQKVLTGLVEGLVLVDDSVLEGWQARARAYPDGLRRAMVERHWRFFPLWHFEARLASRDAVLWRAEELVDAAYNLLAVLAGVNRVYFSRFELKRFRDFTAKLAIAPPRLAERIESLVELPGPEAIREVESLVAETQQLVERELPGLDLSLRRPPGSREQPWALA